MMRAGLPLLSAIALASVGCAGQVRPPSAPPAEEPAEVPVAEPAPPGLADVPVEDARLLLTVSFPQLVGRLPTALEHERVVEEGPAALVPVLEAALAEPAFAESARTLISRKLSVSGVRDGVDFNLPGNLAAHIAKNALPWSQILTADRCYDEAGAPGACDSGAPYAAGVLTTRGYLMSRAGRFNLTRASTLLRAFACEGYPLNEELQPLLPKEQLIELFRAESVEEAAETDERAAGGFGNGEGCYYCHGQFGAHAQLFVKFDDEGRWRAEATGQQDPDGELGRSTGGLMTSHFFDPGAKADEASMMFGRPVANLAEAAQVFVEDPVFSTCAVRNVLEHVLLVDAAIHVDYRILERSAARARERHEDPTLQDIVIATLTDPLVIQSVAASLRGAP
jgi:hypothetical protein